MCRMHLKAVASHDKGGFGRFLLRPYNVGFTLVDHSNAASGAAGAAAAAAEEAEVLRSVLPRVLERMISDGKYLTPGPSSAQLPADTAVV